MNPMNWDRWWNPAATNDPIEWLLQWWFVIPLEYTGTIYLVVFGLTIAAAYTYAAWENNMDSFLPICFCGLVWPVIGPFVLLTLLLAAWWYGVRALRRRHDTPHLVAQRLRGRPASPADQP